MAETLGSLIDKLTIKSIREFYLGSMLKEEKTKLPKKQLKEKLKILKGQKNYLLSYLESFIDLASEGKLALRDQKLKLYNKPETIGRIGKIREVSQAIDALTKKNMELWNLEDEARREDVPFSYIGKIKRKIDFANQQRNDLIDKIDELLEQKIKKLTSKRKKNSGK